MREYKLEFKNHMGAWFMDESICDKMLKYFYDNPQIHNVGKAYYSDEKSEEVRYTKNVDIPEDVLVLLSWSNCDRDHHHHTI